MKVLEKQRGSLLTMLRSLDTLSTVAVTTINKSKADTIADLKAIAPTLRELADSGNDLPDSLQVLLTYPFTDEVLRGVKGDYLNVYLDMTAAPGTQIIPAYEPEPETPAGARAAAGAGLPLPLPATSAPTTGPATATASGKPSQKASEKASEKASASASATSSASSSASSSSSATEGSN